MDVHIPVYCTRKERSELHEKRALYIEEIRRKNYEDIEETEQSNIYQSEIKDITVDIPEETGDPSEKPDYTSDDMLDSNSGEKRCKSWFKYGRRIYSFDKMKDILKGRRQLQKYNHSGLIRYPIYMARCANMVTRRELRSVLRACHIGNFVDIPHDEVLARMKKDIESVLQTCDVDLDTAHLSECIADFKDQLNRWLYSYPNIQIYNAVELPGVSHDPNRVPFPLPHDTMRDLTVFRKWLKQWKPFDCSVPENGAWCMTPLINDVYDDPDEVFMKVVASGRDETLEDLEMEIDGEAAWNVIEMDLIKLDKTTPAQNEIWKKRSLRTNWSNPEWMRKRREQIGQRFATKYSFRDSFMLQYQNFYDKYDEDWKIFEELCKNS